MKKSLILILFILPFVLLGQTKLDTTRIKLKHHFQTQPAYFLDSVNIDISKTYIDIENIESIKITKDTFFTSEIVKIGKVYITSKNKNHKWATFADFKIQKSNGDTNQPKVYIIDGNRISDTSNVRIEESFIKSINILNMADTKGIFYEGPPKTVFVITTKQPSKKRKIKNSR